MRAHIDSLAGVTVEHIAGVSFDKADVKVRRAVQHTTEAGFESSLQTLRQRNSPTLLLGRDRAGQLRAVQFLGVGLTAGCLEHPAGTGETNRLCCAQIELVGYSQKTLWLPDPGLTGLLAAAYQWLNSEWDVPLRHVAARRNRAVFEAEPGWYGHGDVPDQPAGHWDPGNLDYAHLFALALPAPPAWCEKALHLAEFWAWALWRDHGAPEKLRPPQIRQRIPRSWWLRYALHRAGV